MDISEIPTDFVWGGIVVFSRIGSLFAALPGIGESFISARIRLTIAFVVSIGLLPNLSETIPLLPQNIISTFLVLGQEIIIGIFFGCLVRILLAATNLAGNILAMQSSFSSAMMFDPTQGAQSAVIGNFYSLTAMTLIFVSDVHHIMIEGIVDSFHVLQVAHSFFSSDMSLLIIDAVTRSFLIGVKISSPYLVISLLLNVTSGVIARVMPNMQVFFVLAPLQILICLVILYITFIHSLDWYVEELSYIANNFLELK